MSTLEQLDDTQKRRGAPSPNGNGRASGPSAGSGLGDPNGLNGSAGPTEVPGSTGSAVRALRPGARSTATLQWFAAAVVLLDLALIVASGVLASVVRFDPAESQIAGEWRGSALGGVSYTVVALLLTACWVAVIAYRGGYSLRTFGAGADEFKLVIGASVLTAGLVAIVSYLGKIELARGYLAVAFPLGLVFLLLGRYAARKVLYAARRRGRLAHRVLLVGMPAGVGELLEILRRDPRNGLVVVGCCLPRLSQDPGDEVADRGLPILGHLDDVRSAVDASGADTVVVTSLPGRSSRLLRRMSWSLEGLGVDLVVVPSLTDVAGPRIHVRPVAGLPLLHVEEPEFSGARRIVKAGFDRVSAFLATVMALPIMIAVAVAIKLEDGGPVFFRQTRIGLGGEEFSCWKFRSMVVDAERRLSEIQSGNEHDGVLFKIRQDPRRTRVGGFLRKWSLDELPQLFNVLSGKMSLVGPRPPLPSEVAEYGDDARRRLLVKPGITGLWQVSGRSDLSWDDTVRLDLYYVENWSLSADLVIMAKTLGAVLSRNGAY